MVRPVDLGAGRRRTGELRASLAALACSIAPYSSPRVGDHQHIGPRVERLDDTCIASSNDSARARQLSIDPVQHVAAFAGRPIRLTAIEFGILRAFLSRPTAVFNREQIMAAAYRLSIQVSDRTIDSHVAFRRSGQVNKRRTAEFPVEHSRRCRATGSHDAAPPS